MSQVDPGSGFDEEALSELVEDMGESMGKFVNGFLMTLDETRSRMRLAVDAGRLAEVGDNAHRLKGTAGYLGAVELVQTLTDLQQHCADAGEPHRLEALLDRVDRLSAAAHRRLLPLAGT